MKKYLAIMVSTCILLVSNIPFTVSANATYNTHASANQGTIITAGSSWGAADLYRGITSYRITPSAPSTIIYNVVNATRFMVSAAQHSGLSQLLSFEVSTDGTNYTAVNMTVNTISSYTTGNNWPINEQEYVSPDFTTPIKSIRLTKAECYNEFYFAMGDLNYEVVPFTYNTIVSANQGTISTAGSSWGVADLYRNATCYRITPSAPATIIYNVENATRFMVSAAQHNGLSQLLTFEVSTDGTIYTAVSMAAKTISSYIMGGTNWPINEQEYVSPEFTTPVKAIRITKSESYNEYYFAMVDLKYERVKATYNTTVSANNGLISTAGSNWDAADLYRNSTCYRITPTAPATIVYNVENATRFMVSAAQHNGLSQLLTFEASTDGTNFTLVSMKTYTSGKYISGVNWPINEQDYVSPEFATPVKAIRITKAECYNEFYFAMVDLKYEMDARITSNSYLISDNTKLIKGISVKTPANDVLSSLVSSVNVIIVDENNIQLAGNTFVGTGMKLQRKFGAQVAYELVVVVKGDVTGDGEISILDLGKIKLHLLSTSKLIGVKLIAGDLSEKGSITISDLLSIKKILLGL